MELSRSQRAAVKAASAGTAMLTVSGAQAPPTTNHQPPTTNHQPPTTNMQHVLGGALMLKGITRGLRVALIPTMAAAAVLASTGVMHADPGPNPPAIAPAIAPQGPGAVNQGGV